MLICKNIRILFVLFAIVEAGILCWWLNSLDGYYDNEDFIFFQAILAVLGAPGTFLAFIAISIVDYMTPLFVGHTKLAAIGIWCTLVAVTYMQWFVWLPRWFCRSHYAGKGP